jgi:hypothetical protein
MLVYYPKPKEKFSTVKQNQPNVQITIGKACGFTLHSSPPSQSQ